MIPQVILNWIIYGLNNPSSNKLLHQTPQTVVVFAKKRKNTRQLATQVSKALCEKIMLQIRLTGKLQKELGIKPIDLHEPVGSSKGLGNWTANLFTEDRRKALIFINEKTLYSFMLFGVRKDNIKNIKQVFINGLVQLLEVDGFTDQEIIFLTTEYTEIQFTKTNSKKILGNLNDITQIYKASIYENGGYKHANIGEIIYRYNRMPQRNIGWGFSVEAVKEIAVQPKSA